MEMQGEKGVFRSTIFLILSFIVLPFSGIIFRYLFKNVDDHFSSKIITWITIYYTIAFMKHNMHSQMMKNRTNLRLFLTGFVGTCGMVWLSNIVGSHWKIFQETPLIWNSNANPFIILMIIGVFNIFRTIKMQSKIINYISSLSLFIYIIHENILIRYLVRPALWDYFYKTFGYSHIIVLVFIQVFLIFAVSFLLSAIYMHTLHKAIVKLCKILYPKIALFYCKIEKRVLQRYVSKVF